MVNFDSIDVNSDMTTVVVNKPLTSIITKKRSQQAKPHNSNKRQKKTVSNSSAVDPIHDIGEGVVDSSLVHNHWSELCRNLDTYHDYLRKKHLNKKASVCACKQIVSAANSVIKAPSVDTLITARSILQPLEGGITRESLNKWANWAFEEVNHKPSSLIIILLQTLFDQRRKSDVVNSSEVRASGSTTNR